MSHLYHLAMEMFIPHCTHCSGRNVHKAQFTTLQMKQPHRGKIWLIRSTITYANYTQSKKFASYICFTDFWYLKQCGDGEDQLDRSCEKWRSVTERQENNEYPTHNTKEKGYIGTAFQNTLLKKQWWGKREVTGGRGRRSWQLLDYRTEMTGH